MYMDKIQDLLKKIKLLSSKLPIAQDSEKVNEAQIELSPEERKSRFRRYLTILVGEGWHIEIENEFNAVLRFKTRSGFFIAFIIFVILLLIFGPLALFYLVYVIVTRIRGKQKLHKVWIDIYGNIKSN